MSRVDMFCAGDDRHRVALLEDLLQQAGQRVVLHSAAVERPSDPCIVACTARALKKPWIVELFSAGVAVVALRLDDTPLPGPCSRVIDLQSWPARSADRHVGALVDWLIRHGHGSSAAADRAADAGPEQGAADTVGAAAAGQGGIAAARGTGRWRPRRAGNEARRALIILGILLVGGVLLWSSAPQRGADAPIPAEQAAAAEYLAETLIRLDAPVDPLPAAAADVDAGVLAWIAEAPAVLADARPNESADLKVPAADPAAPLPAAAHADALAHLCAAGSLRAARAWAAALNWKQRRRAADEACVARLLARPGYRVLAPLLGLP